MTLLFVCLFVFQSSYEDTMISKKSYACVNFIQTKFQKVKIKFYYFMNQKDVWMLDEVHLIYLPWNFLKVWVKITLMLQSLYWPSLCQGDLRPDCGEGPDDQEAQAGVPWFCPTSRHLWTPLPLPHRVIGYILLLCKKVLKRINRITSRELAINGEKVYSSKHPWIQQL